MLPAKAFTDVIREWSEVFMRHSGRDFRQFMSDSSLSFSQITVLMRLYHKGNSGLSGLGEELGVTLAAASQTIDRLVNLGLISRSEDPQDRRVKQLALTEKGCHLVENAIEARSRWIEDLTTALTPEQQEMVINSLTLVTEAARKMDK
jgi:DNA-binding MarR family transcriptional regulator